MCDATECSCIYKYFRLRIGVLLAGDLLPIRHGWALLIYNIYHVSSVRITLKYHNVISARLVTEVDKLTCDGESRREGRLSLSGPSNAYLLQSASTNCNHFRPAGSVISRTNNDRVIHLHGNRTCLLLKPMYKYQVNYFRLHALAMLQWRRRLSETFTTCRRFAS